MRSGQRTGTAGGAESLTVIRQSLYVFLGGAGGSAAESGGKHEEQQTHLGRIDSKTKG